MYVLVLSLLHIPSTHPGCMFPSVYRTYALDTAAEAATLMHGPGMVVTRMDTPKSEIPWETGNQALLIACG